MTAADRALRRFVPITSLLTVALGFPDAAPSRFRTAMRSTTTNQLRRRVLEAIDADRMSTGLDRNQYLLDLVSMLTLHDRQTRGHSERVRAYSTLIGEELHLSNDDQQKLFWAALLHDIGKLDVPGEILNKPGKPTSEEWEVLKGHPSAGERYMAPLDGWLGEWGHAAAQHHLRWDGEGYPVELSGTDISLSGRIVAIADAYDVMTSTRSYKKPMSAADARVELSACAGGQFDPTVVRAFLNIGLHRLRLTAGMLASLPALVTPIIGGLASNGGRALVAAGVATTSLASTPVVPLGPTPVVVASEAVAVEPIELLVTSPQRPSTGTTPSPAEAKPDLAPTPTSESTVESVPVPLHVFDDLYEVSGTEPAPAAAALPGVTATAAATALPAVISTPAATAAPTVATAIATATPTVTATPTALFELEARSTVPPARVPSSPTPTAVPALSPTPTSTAIPLATSTPQPPRRVEPDATPSSVPDPSPTPTSVPTPTPTELPTPTPTASPTELPTPTPTVTPRPASETVEICAAETVDLYWSTSQDRSPAYRFDGTRFDQDIGKIWVFAAATADVDDIYFVTDGSAQKHSLVVEDFACPFDAGGSVSSNMDKPRFLNLQTMNDGRLRVTMTVIRLDGTSQIYTYNASVDD